MTAAPVTALVVGCGAGVMTEALSLPVVPDLVIAVNDQIRDWPGPLDVAASLHPDRLAGWLAGRSAPVARVYAPTEEAGVTHVMPRRAHWHGTSGLYAVEVAFALGATRVVLAGVPIDDGPHHAGPHTLAPWGPYYREGWRNAAPALSRHVRSMGGWTARLFGQPDRDWLAAPLSPPRLPRD
ncbi:hypothetical protein [Niveispirillum fermenti]|uniref:hypothetical protein n=1 Tax=Niveispirillum fermenti TaxID=1233113 RepID=UPI003A8785F2